MLARGLKLAKFLTVQHGEAPKAGKDLYSGVLTPLLAKQRLPRFIYLVSFSSKSQQEGNVGKDRAARVAIQRTMHPFRFVYCKIRALPTSPHVCIQLCDCFHQRWE